jgi:hypothetical protein
MYTKMYSDLRLSEFEGVVFCFFYQPMVDAVYYVVMREKCRMYIISYNAKYIRTCIS